MYHDQRPLPNGAADGHVPLFFWLGVQRVVNGQ
jgi:hypothetical protein